MRKRTRRRIVVPLPPPGLRPKLSADQVQDLGLVHWANLDALAKGEGTVDLLWQVAGGVFTWSKAADLLATRCPDYQPAVDEMRAQLDLATRLVERYGATGRVLLTGPDYQPAVDEMRAQLDLATRLVERYGATGRVLLTGPDYQLAKHGAAVMDELAKVVDRAIAIAAAEWSEAYVSQLAARHARPVFPKAPAIAEADIPY